MVSGPPRGAGRAGALGQVWAPEFNPPPPPAGPRLPGAALHTAEPARRLLRGAPAAPPPSCFPAKIKFLPHPALVPGPGRRCTCEAALRFLPTLIPGFREGWLAGRVPLVRFFGVVCRRRTPRFIIATRFHQKGTAAEPRFSFCPMVLKRQPIYSVGFGDFLFRILFYGLGMYIFFQCPVHSSRVNFLKPSFP